jgi:hypothetical protein
VRVPADGPAPPGRLGMRLQAVCGRRTRWASGLASRASRPAESSGICRRRVGVPRRQGRAKIIPVGGATGVGLLAVTSDQQIGCCRVTGGWRRPALAWRAGGPVA